MYPKDFGWYLVGAGRRDAGTVGDFAKSRFGTVGEMLSAGII